VWEPDRDTGTDKPAREAIEVDVPDDDPGAPAASQPISGGEPSTLDAVPADAPLAEAPEAAADAPPAAEPPVAAPVPEPSVATPVPEPALVEAAAAGAAAALAAEPSRRRWGRTKGDATTQADDDAHPNAPIVVFFILLGIVFAFVFLVAAVSTVTHINDIRQAAGKDPDANLSVYLRAIGDSSGFGVMAVLCWVGAGIIGRLD
jgi:hypothetical protein